MARKSTEITDQKPKWINAIPIVLGVLIYLTTFNHDFVLDDNLVLKNNAYVSNGISEIPTLLKTNYANGNQSFNDGLYRPLSLVTFAIEQSLFNLNPTASHTIQALLYGLLLMGLMLWLQTLFIDKKDWAFWIVLLFAVHPIHTEVVANLKSRDEILALLFFAFSAWHFTKWIDEQKRKQLLYSLLLFTFALFSKESAITFIAIFPLIIWFKSEKLALNRLKSSFLFVIPAALFLSARSIVLSNMGEVDSGVTGILQNVITTSDNFIERLATAATVQGLYMTKLFIPTNLSHDYSYNSIPLVDMSNLGALLWTLAVVALLFFAVKGFFKREWWSFGIIFYFVTISVVSNVFILIGALAAERFVFAPSLGWAVAIVAFVSNLKPLKQKSQYIFIPVALIFTVLSLSRIPDWKSNYTLFSADVSKVPESARAHYNVGTAANERAKSVPTEAKELRSDAAQHLAKAIEIWPDYQDAYNNLGVVYMKAKEYQKAYETYQKLLKRFPNYSKGIFNLANTCYQMKNYEQAELYFEKYYDLVPNNDALYFIAESEGYQNKFDEAIDHLTLLTALEPNDPRSFLKLGMAYAITGNQEVAENFLLTAVKLGPNNAETHFNLGLLYFNTNRKDLGKESMRNALSIDPSLDLARQLLNQP